MKLVVNKDVLLDGLQKVQAIVATRTTLPVLYNVCLKADASRVWLTTTDLEVTVRTSLEAKIARQGATTLPAKRLFSICRELPAHEVEIDVDDKDVATVRAGSSFYKIIGISDEEFPPMPEFHGQITYTLEQSVLRAMLAATHYAASKDENRFVLTGTLLHFKGGKLSVVATDGRRMAMWEQEVDAAHDPESSYILPFKTVSELMKSLGAEGTVTIQVADKQLAFEFGSIRLITKLVDGTFPNFRQVIPTETGERVTIVREELLSALKRVALLVSDKTSSVTLNFGKDNLEIVGTAADIGEARETVAIKYRGKDLAIAFNPDFLMDPLRNLDTAEIALDLSNELSPGVLRCDKPFLYVIMPMRVK